MMSDFDVIGVEYNPVRVSGRFFRIGVDRSSIWDRLLGSTVGVSSDATIAENTLEVPWPTALSLIRDYGSRSQQEALRFRFRPIGEEAQTRIRAFATDVQRANAAKRELPLFLTREDIESRLRELGFTKRTLKPFQVRDLERLISLPHGANFSVPGAGKTTVTFALHLLTRSEGQHLFVVAPRAAFPTWKAIVNECISADAPHDSLEPFTILEGQAAELDGLLQSGATRFLISYDLMLRNPKLFSNYLARHPVHLVLDESHRMKAGQDSQRGAYLLSVSVLPLRRDILTGTPMPQRAEDLAAQLGFLWPGQGLDLQITRGASPRDVLGKLYVRTTKGELGLPEMHRHFMQIEMAPGHAALYGIVRDEALRQLSSFVRARDVTDIARARKSVIRLLQLSTNPVLALQSMSNELGNAESGVIDQVLVEGPSAKMQAVASHAREIARSGEKVVIWTIFTNTLLEMERMLADLNPVVLYGAVPSGEDSDPETREGRLRRFHTDQGCMCLIANPAAAGEGMSLHTVCHNAIYLDRSYVSTHYLQSIDRIHRLGLPRHIVTNVYIYQTKAPAGLGSIDYSVNRRLATKIRALQQLLDDDDLHEVALDEETAADPVDYDVDFEDLIDLVAELEGHRLFDQDRIR